MVQRLTMRCDRLYDPSSRCPRGEIGQPDQQDAAVVEASVVDERAEVLVEREQHRIPRDGDGEDRLIGRSSGVFADPIHVVASLLESGHTVGVDTFVGDEVHFAADGCGKISSFFTMDAAYAMADRTCSRTRKG